MKFKETSPNQQWEKVRVPDTDKSSNIIFLTLNYKVSDKLPLALDVGNNNSLVVKPFSPTAKSQQWILDERLTSVSAVKVSYYSGPDSEVTLVQKDTSSQEQLFDELVRLICWDRCVHLWMVLCTVCFGNVQQHVYLCYCFLFLK